MKYGIDISEHNGYLDICALDPDFVIIRAGYGTKNYDKLVERNISICQQNRIPYGLYWYSYALTKEDARKEASKVNELLQHYNPSYGVWYDMEDGDAYKRSAGFKISKDTIQPIIDSFMSAVICGIKGVYVSESWLQYIDQTKYPVWVASWGKNDGDIPDKDFSDIAVMWQYTSRYKGMNLDADILYEDMQGKASPEELLYMAIDTLHGYYGNGDQRKYRLGSYYERVQRIINIAYGKDD